MAPILYPPSLLSADQVLQHAYDDATQTLRTTATAIIVGQPIQVDINMFDDSVRLGDGTDFFTSTTIGPKVGLDVNIIGPISTVLSNDTDYGIVGPNTIRTAAQIGNATGAADFNTGVITSQTLRVVLPTDQTAIPVTQSGVWSIIVSNFPATVDTNYGVVGANTIRTASQIGNATGAADFDAGITTAQTLRVVLPTDQSDIPISDNSGDYASTAVITVVGRTNVSTALKAANSNRRGLILHNDSTGLCYVAFAGTASLSAFTVRMTGNSTLSLDKIPVYTGIVTGIWASSGLGDMKVTELT